MLLSTDSAHPSPPRFLPIYRFLRWSVISLNQSDCKILIMHGRKCSNKFSFEEIVLKLSYLQIKNNLTTISININYHSNKFVLSVFFIVNYIDL